MNNETTISNDNATCPYCFKVNEGSWEWRSDEGAHDCEWCGKLFQYEREHTTIYRTSWTRPAGENKP
jgi:hypothetical protein